MDHSTGRVDQECSNLEQKNRKIEVIKEFVPVNTQDPNMLASINKLLEAAKENAEETEKGKASKKKTEAAVYLAKRLKVSVRVILLLLS